MKYTYYFCVSKSLLFLVLSHFGSKRRRSSLHQEYYCYCYYNAKHMGILTTEKQSICKCFSVEMDWAFWAHAICNVLKLFAYVKTVAIRYLVRKETPDSISKGGSNI